MCCLFVSGGACCFFIFDFFWCGVLPSLVLVVLVGVPGCCYSTSILSWPLSLFLLLPLRSSETSFRLPFWCRGPRPPPRPGAASGAGGHEWGSRRIVGQQVAAGGVDDLDGGGVGGVVTVLFGLDGVEFEVELEVAEAARLRSLLGRYAVRARSVLRKAEPVVRGTRPSPVRSLDVEELRAVRAWARGRGFSVSERGRLPEAVLSAYEEAHPNSLGARRSVPPYYGTGQ